MDDHVDDRTYHVVINGEEQYSIWVTDRAIPAGWRAVGPSGSKAECLTYIDEVWTDMRPLSLRKRMEAQQQSRTESAADSRGSGLPPEAWRLSDR